MLFRTYGFLVGLALVCAGRAQNLVPNPSFEEHTECPSEYGQIFLVQNWLWPVMGTPDYFNACDADGPMGVPRNVFGYQQPASGNAYVGIWGYGGTDTPYGLHEIIGTRLPTPLQVGETYWASFKVSWSSGYPFIETMTGFASNKLGMLLSNDPLSGESDWVPWFNRAQVFTETIITDSAGWTIISGQFITDSAYQYLYVGNFFGDDHTQVIDMQPDADDFSYYYVDDVCLSTSPSDCPLAVGIADTDPPPPNIAFSPLSDQIWIAGLAPGTYAICLYDALGRILYQGQIHSQGEQESISVHLTKAPNSLAILRLQSSGWEWTIKLLLSP